MGLSYWSLTLYPQAGEAGGCFNRRGRAAEGGGGEPDVERAQEEAARRARTKVRRYCAANRLNRLATLTYAGEGCFDPSSYGPTSPGSSAASVPSWAARRLPYLWVPEWHPGGHGLHVHFAVGRFVRAR